MAELPGWDRDRLRTAAPQDVAAARLMAFTRAVRPILTRDIDTELAHLARHDMTPAAREREEKRERAVAREALHRLSKTQAALREQLGLDDA